MSDDTVPDKKFKKKSITKADIGIPLNFQHISHVGWDPNTGFEIGNVDESIRQFFDKVISFFSPFKSLLYFMALFKIRLAEWIFV